MFKPTAPQGWNAVGEKVIIASKSTTRYVVLKTDGKVQLHPVLNMASAKLLLKTGKGDVVTVDESILDRGTIPRGVTIGIPYAPTGFPPRPRRAPRSAGPSANARARAAGPSRRPRSSWPHATWTRPKEASRSWPAANCCTS